MPTQFQTTKPPTECEKQFKGDAGTLTTRSANLTTLAAALKYSKVNLEEWEVEKHVINSWEVTLSGHRSHTGLDQTYTNYQVKVWLRRKTPSRAETFSEEFRRRVQSYRPPRYVRPKPVRGQYLYEVGISDIHLGKLAQAAETGWQNYDCKIAAREFRLAAEALLSRAPGGTGEILLAFGNDQFNADNESQQTTAGTPQDCDGRFSKTYRLGYTLAIEAIDKALAIAPVRVVICPGNHDRLTSFHLGEVLSAWYRQNRHVKIDNGSQPRKYVHYGNNLIGYTHGDRQNELKMLPNLMASEMRHVWPQVRHKEWRVGHFHQLKVQEIVGVVIRTLSALCPPDKWHSLNGYVGNLQGAQGFSWHKQHGLEETFCHNITSRPLIEAL